MKSCGRLSIGLPERFTPLQEGRLSIGRRISSCPTMAHAVSALKYPPHLRRSETRLDAPLFHTFSQRNRPVRIGVDAGGTFTDFVILHDDGRLESFKLRSNPASPAAVILEGINRATSGGRAEVVHGSTVATNALLERKGARTAFVTTDGFTDLVFIGRQNRPQLYNLTPPLRRPLIPPALCFGVKERTYFDGAVGSKPTVAELK